MQLKVNSKDYRFSGQNLADLVKEKDLAQRRGFALAVNEEVVPRSQWEKTQLKENDHILIIQPTQGG